MTFSPAGARATPNRGDYLCKAGEEDGIVATEAYCVKCREKREMKDEKEVTMKNGRNAVEGTCPVCGTRLFRMTGKKS
jgi:hypothetical protein